ncbi:MAG: hypothetical protein VX777_08255 [Chlamydiota bacterium]|nr:hypothetical protein [Chlamydiota bacterium]
MELNNFRRLAPKILWVVIAILILYGFSRLYYWTTDGFAIMHIQSDYSYDERWVTRPLTPEERDTVEQALGQPFRYLGKGCQSYVFGSEDGEYVIKFLKYQRLREKKWLEILNFLPFVENYCTKKNEKKRLKRNGVFSSWKLAFDKLSKETGVVYVHLNKSNDLNKLLSITDKVGNTYDINIDNYEFMIQRRATMLCEEIDSYMANGQQNKAGILLKSLVTRILSEYQRGLADNDHALIQNTGVCCGEPIHVDIGQFVEEEVVKDPSFHMQELYTKMYKFRLWLREKHPSLCDEFEDHLQQVIGDDFKTMKPLWRERIEIFQ